MTRHDYVMAPGDVLLVEDIAGDAGCEACDTPPLEMHKCEGCYCCQECCNCAESDCDCDACLDRRILEEL